MTREFKKIDESLFTTAPCITRYPDTILSYKDVPYRSALTFNAGVLKKDGKYIMIFRNDLGDYETQHLDRNEHGCTITNLGLAFSDDGIKWKVEPEPCFDLHGEEINRVYDPRITYIDGEYCICFAVDTLHGVCGGMAVTKDLKHFEVKSISVPENRNMVLFPEKINGKYYMLNRPCSSGDSNYGKIFISESPDMIYWGKHKLLSANRDAKTNYWERKKIGAGPAPIKTDEGWLLIYHGVQATISDYTYSFGVMLLDLNDPTKVLYKAKRYLLTPEEPYERSGFCDNVCFPCAALCDSEGKVTIYYGVVDTNMAIAFTTVDKLLEFVKKYD